MNTTTDLSPLGLAIQNATGLDPFVAIVLAVWAAITLIALLAWLSPSACRHRREARRARRALERAALEEIRRDWTAAGRSGRIEVSA